jgi:hypothetical protein
MEGRGHGFLNSRGASPELESLLHGHGEASPESEGFHAMAETQVNLTQRAKRKGAKDAERVLEEWSVKDGTRIELIGMMWTAAG